MYLPDPTYAAVSALIHGYDLAKEGGVLCGFREWLITRLGTGDNLAWPVLVLHTAFPNASDPREIVRSSPAMEGRAIETLFELLAEFDRARSGPDGMRRVFLDYEAWLRQQSWYKPNSPHWIEFPRSTNRASRPRQQRG
jgi:hypothetical protein